MSHAPALIDALRQRLRAMAGTVRDRGASALEFAIIAAVVVVLASVIGAVVYNVVSGKSTQLQDCANKPISDVCNTGGTP